MSRPTPRYRPTTVAAAVLATLTAGAGALPASAATDPIAAPSFIDVGYDGDTFAPDSFHSVSIGSEQHVVFNLDTNGVTDGSVAVHDANGHELCTAPVLAGTIGIAHCTTDGPLAPGMHDVTATTTAAAGASAESPVLHLGVYGDDHTGGAPAPIVAQPAPGDTDAGFTVQQPVVDPVVAVPSPGGTDPGFTANGVAAPVVTLGELVGDRQSLLFDAPELGNDGGRGHIKVYDASGALVQDREWSGPLGPDGVQLWVTAPHGERTVFHAEYVLPAGTSARTEIVLDKTADALPAPSFAFEPGVQDSRVFCNLHGVPGATATFTDSDGSTQQQQIGATGMAAFTGTVARNAQNTYSITQTKAGQTSAPLTYEVDTRTGGEDIVAQPAPGETDPGFTAPGKDTEDIVAQPAPGETDPGFTAPGAEEIAAPIVTAGRVLPDGRSARLTIASGLGDTGWYLITDESGVTTKKRIAPTWDYDVRVSHTGAQTFTVVKQVGDAVSAPTTFRVRGL